MPSKGQDASLTAAARLGWRIAELYAQVNDTGEPADGWLLPTHQSLEPADQLELQLRAAQGGAQRASVPADAVARGSLVGEARNAPGSGKASEQFRAKVRDWHVELQKELWAVGEAYELGNEMSDTYNRVCGADREQGGEDAVKAEWLPAAKPGPLADTQRRAATASRRWLRSDLRETASPRRARASA